MIGINLLFGDIGIRSLITSICFFVGLFYLFVSVFKITPFNLAPIRVYSFCRAFKNKNQSTLDHLCMLCYQEELRPSWLDLRFPQVRPSLHHCYLLKSSRQDLIYTSQTYRTNQGRRIIFPAPKIPFVFNKTQNPYRLIISVDIVYF